MMLADYIAALQVLMEEVGPLVEVEKWMPAKGRHSAPSPKKALARKYERAAQPQFYNPEYDTPAQRGDVVIRV